MSHPSLNGRVVLVTGGSRGLGREMALALAAAGARLCLTGSRPSDRLDATLAEVRATGAEAVAVAADAADPAAAEAAVDACLAAFGRIDVLINNAGLGMRMISETFNTTPTKFWEADPEAWGRITRANVDGPFHMARAAVPHMVAAGSGKVINVSTSPPTMVRRGYAPYGPSKAFLEAATRVWAQDLEGTGVTVNALLPGGATDTELLPPGARAGADGNLLPADVMNAAALWLCSDLSDGITAGRFVGRRWDPADPSAMRDDRGEAPAIL